MNDLSSFLDQQRQAGAVESVGSFTVAIEKAREKMGAHALVNHEDYLLKLVQCATAVGTSELHIKLQRRVVMVYFETDAEDTTVSVERVSNCLAAPLEESNPARAHLAMAVCAMINQDPVELMWGEWDSEKGGTILSFGTGRAEVFREAPFPREEPLAQGRRFFLLYFVKQPSQLPFAQTKLEHSATLQRCCFAPMPIYLDGKPVGPRLPLLFPPSDPTAKLTAPYIGALRVERGERQPLRWEGERVPVNRDLPHELTQLSPNLLPVLQYEVPDDFPIPLDLAVNFAALYALPIYLHGASSIHYVKDGVLLYPVPVNDGGGGAIAVLPGNHLKTDLTGFQVVSDDSVDDDKARCETIWKEMAEKLASVQPPILTSTRQLTREGGLAALLGCCLLAPVGILVGPLYAFFMSRGSTKPTGVQRRLRKQLEYRKDYLAYCKQPLVETQSALGRFDDDSAGA